MLELEPPEAYLLKRKAANQRTYDEWCAENIAPGVTPMGLPIDKLERSTGRSTALLMEAICYTVNAGQPCAFVARDDTTATTMQNRLEEWMDVLGDLEPGFDVEQLRRIEIYSRVDFSKAVRNNMAHYVDLFVIYDHDQPWGL
jgi:hypothetical protein